MTDREAEPAARPATDRAATARVAIAAIGLGVTYPGRQRPALEALSVEVRPGERIALVGPSGSGKSTLLRALEGSIRPTCGEVVREGFVGLVHQDLRLVSERSALENVGCGALGEIFWARGLFRLPARIRRRAEELLEEIGLAGHGSDGVGELSGGQRQRVAIARVLCAQPAVLLADEPLGSLDPRNASRVLDLLRRLQERRGFALVVSVHDRVPDPTYFDRWIVLRDGRIACETRRAEEAWSVVCAPIPPASPPATASPRTPSPVDPSPTAIRERRPALVLRAFGWGALAVALAWAARGVGLRTSSFDGAAAGLAGFAAAVVPGSVAEVAGLPWARLAWALVETVEMALLGTSIGIAVSLPLAIVAARATSPRPLRIPVRFLLNVVRTVPSIFWALLFVAFVGLGPVAGVFALAAYSTGYLTKLFYESLEDVDDRPALALRALGLSRLQVLTHAVFPAARPLLLGSCLFVFEYNIRAASVLGVVGAGGIGQDLMYYVEWRNFPAASAGLLMILGVVVTLDTISEAWRRRLARQRGT